MKQWRSRKSQLNASQICGRAAAACLIFYLAFNINAALDELLVSETEGNSARDAAKKKKMKPWPPSTVRTADSSICLGDDVCEEALQENPIFGFVSLKDSTLELYGMDAFNPDFHRIPQEVSDWKRLTDFPMGYKLLRRRRRIRPDSDCDLILDNRVVFLDVPVHCSNDFHVYNNNIFKHLVSVEVAQEKGPLSSITLLQLKPRCQPSRVLREWYTMFGEVYSFDKLVKSGERICIKHLQYPRTSPEVFNRMHPRQKTVPVPFSHFNQHLVNRFKTIVDSRWRQAGFIKRLQVDRSSFRNQVVTILEKETSNGFGHLGPEDESRLKRALEERGAKVFVLRENRDYRNLDKLLSTLGDTAIIIGPHGPALANAIYAPRGALIVELYGDYARNSRSYETMAAYQGQDHVYVDFEGYGAEGRNITDSDVSYFVNRVVEFFEQPGRVNSYSLANQARFWQ